MKIRRRITMTYDELKKLVLEHMQKHDPEIVDVEINTFSEAQCAIGQTGVVECAERIAE